MAVLDDNEIVRLKLGEHTFFFSKNYLFGQKMVEPPINSIISKDDCV